MNIWREIIRRQADVSTMRARLSQHDNTPLRRSIRRAEREIVRLIRRAEGAPAQ